jgi:hypothetical protein
MSLEAEDKAPNRFKLAHCKGPNARALMSALGHKRTCTMQNQMSVLPPRADIDWPAPNVRFVPIADIHKITQPRDELAALGSLQWNK